jgi:hypothetical protein
MWRRVQAEDARTPLGEGEIAFDAEGVAPDAMEAVPESARARGGRSPPAPATAALT